MDFKDYYKILGVDEQVDDKTLKTAYRRLAKKYHPDVSSEHGAEDKFKEVAEAYEVLKDADKRAKYDELKKYGSAGQGFQPPPGWQSQSAAGGQGFGGGEDFSDFFSSVFGGRARQQGFRQAQPRARRGQDIETELPIFLEDTLAGQTKTISYSLPHYDDEGRVKEINKTLNVKIPAGVQDGERIRLKHQGAPGVGDAPSGDLYLHIRLVPHPLFDVEGHNLIITVPLAPWEAVLGAKIAVPTLSGTIQLQVPANSQTGQRLRIKGKGLAMKQGNGDLHALLKIVVPPAASKAQKEQWQVLADSAEFDPRAEWSK